MIRQVRLVAVVGAFVIGCAGLLVLVGCAGVRSEAPKEQQGQTEATKEQGRSPEATASEEARCEGTRTINELKKPGIKKVHDSSVQPGDPEALYTTNDVPGCPNGGLLSGTDKPDYLWGLDGEDEIRGLGAKDWILGGAGNDVIYGGPGDDSSLHGDEGDDVIYGGAGDESVIVGANGEDVIYGGDGDDQLWGTMDGGDRDELYCGEGKDIYDADKNDYVDSSCEKKN